MIANLILAAGQSTRMGGVDKLLEPVKGQPLLRLVTARALSTGPTFVTLPSLTHKRRFVLPPAALVVTAKGQMSDSIKAGIAALPVDATGVMILPADMPDITSKDMQKIHDAAVSAKIVRATTDDGQAGHPTYFARSMFHHLDSISGDTGAGNLLKTLEDQTTFIPLDAKRARLDLDTPADWDAYRRRPSS